MVMKLEVSTNMNKYDELLKKNDKKVKNIITLLLIAFVFIYMYVYVEFDILYFVVNIGSVLKLLWELTFGVIIGLFTDDSLRQYFITIQKPMLETIQMSLIGTFFGAIIGLFMALFSSEVFVPKYVYIPMRFLGSILRAVPTLMYAAIFVVIFGSGAIAGIVAVTIFSFTIIAKMTFENISEIDQAPVEALNATGASKLMVMRYAVIPQISALFVSTVLFTFEINIRASLILGYVGAGGIGENLQSSFQNANYERVGLIIMYTYLVVVIVDLISNAIRRKII